MEKIGICGHFAFGKNLKNGQTIKGLTIYNCLKEKYGTEGLLVLDTRHFFYHFFTNLIRYIKMFNKCTDIIIMPGKRGLFFFAPIGVLFKLKNKRVIHYIVIGGWLYSYLSKHKFLKFFVRKLDFIYVETNKMKADLEKIEIDNVTVVPNFKKIEPIKDDEITKMDKNFIRVCTFSRVIKEKGIEIAAEAVSKANLQLECNVYHLDIYGQIEASYRDDFLKFLNQQKNCISYCGEVESDDSINCLKNYFLLLFPTFYEGEGFPGTIIDAFSSGLPVIASDWKYNKEIICSDECGYLLDENTSDCLAKKLIDIYNNYELWERKKCKVLEISKNYYYKNLIEKITNNFKIKESN